MPSALMSYESMSEVAQHQPREGGDSLRKGTTGRVAREPAICPTDDEAIAPRKKPVDKRSLDYLWRTGVAGGVAGCAVGSTAKFSRRDNCAHPLKRPKPSLPLSTE